VLACGLALGWAGAILFAAVTVTTRPVTEQAAQFMSAIGGAIAGALATYLGSTLHHPGEPLRRRRDDWPPGDDRHRPSPSLTDPDRV
jgi:hypothetical protein